MVKKKEDLVCKECGMKIPYDFPECLICGQQSDLFPTGKHEGSLLPKLEDVDLEEAVRRNRDFFRNFEHELNPRCIDTDKLSDEFSAEKVIIFLGEN